MSVFNLDNLLDVNIAGHNMADVYVNGDKLWEEQADWQGLTFEALQADCTCAFYNVGLNNPRVFYSRDAQNWTTWSAGTPVVLSNVGQKLYVKGDNASGFSSSTSDYTYFYITGGKVAASGNVNSLLDNDDGSSVNSIPNNYCYCSLFKSCKLLTSAPKLPVVTLKVACYRFMFSDCTNLLSAPELPATTAPSSCYSEMFKNCSSLTSAPELPATSLGSYCYNQMFYGCSKLTTPPELPATNVDSSCYSEMFRDCTKLTSAPVLRATTLQNGCYNMMFRRCSQLKVTENSGDHLIFTCPSTTDLYYPVTNMFLSTGGAFTGTPTTGKSYYWNE